ncbi:MAG: malate dehydrogenase [Acidiferrobacterales bacterium]
MEKITIVGAGRVGESTAQNLAKGELCRHVALIDIVEGMPQGTALDIQESAPEFGFDTNISGHNELSAMEGSELVIITAGIPRKPGMSRSDVLETNLNILDGIMDAMQRTAPNAMVMLVSNPVDILTYAAWKETGWSRNRVFGMAGVLDSSRMASFVAMETGFSVKDIDAMVMGGHGDTMVPMTRFTTINGIPINLFLGQDKIDSIVKRTREGGAEILALKKNSSAYDAPAASIAAMVSAIVHDRKRILPCVAVLDGEYGETNICMGVPCVIGAGGIERIIELPLNNEESTQFKHSVQAIRRDLSKI